MATAAELALELAAHPKRKRWTRTELARFAESGLLDVERYELIGGELIEIAGKDKPHQVTLTLLTEWLRSLFPYRQVQEEFPIPVSGPDAEINDPQPDAVVLKEPVTAYLNRDHGPEDVLLAVEVSDTTASFDLSVKASLYARAGIREYWVIDIRRRRIVVHREPRSGAYGRITSVAADHKVQLLVKPGAEIEVSKLIATSSAVESPTQD